MVKYHTALHGLKPVNEPTKLLILDMDETLVHSCSEWIGRKADLIAADHMIFVRPYAKAFIRLALQCYKVAIWTASYGQYTRDILAHLFDDISDIEFIWDRNDCRRARYDSGNEYFAKELSKLEQIGWADDSYLIVDDMPEHIVGSQENVIAIKPYFGSIHDAELFALAERLGLNE